MFTVLTKGTFLGFELQVFVTVQKTSGQVGPLPKYHNFAPWRVFTRLASIQITPVILCCSRSPLSKSLQWQLKGPHCRGETDLHTFATQNLTRCLGVGPTRLRNVFGPRVVWPSKRAPDPASGRATLDSSVSLASLAQTRPKADSNNKAWSQTAAAAKGSL